MVCVTASGDVAAWPELSAAEQVKQLGDRTKSTAQGLSSVQDNPPIRPEEGAPHTTLQKDRLVPTMLMHGAR